MAGHCGERFGSLAVSPVPQIPCSPAELGHWGAGVLGHFQMLKNPFILFVVAVVLFLAFLPSYQKMQDLAQKNLECQQQIYELVDENRRLEEEKRLLEEDPTYLEKVAREKMGLIREGEVIYKIAPVEAPVGNGAQ